MLELRQTRDLTRAEASQLSMYAMRANARAAAHDPIYWLCMIVLALCIVFIIVATREFFYLARCAGVRFPHWAELAFFVGIGALVAARFRWLRAITALNRQKHCAGSCYAVTMTGLSIDMRGMTTSVPWHCIRAISRSGPNCLVYLNAVQLIAITRAPFEGQDVEAFCAELERRWRAARSQADDAAAGGAS